MALIKPICGLLLTSSVLYVVGHVVYNLFFHPLRNFPGPISMRAMRLTSCYKLIMGTLPFDMLELHKKYGEVVRIAPNELAFMNPSAWKDIMGHRTGGRAEMEKWVTFYKPVEGIPSDIVSATREEHSVLRRQLAHGFSDRSMRDQQPIIKMYIDLLMQKLHEHCKDGTEALDLAAWYNFTTFDIIGDLAFGESFGCLDSSEYHPWVKVIFQMARAGTILQTVSHFPMMKNLLFAMVPQSIKNEEQKHKDMTKAKLLKRMESEKDRPDLIDALLKKKEAWGYTMDKLQANSSTLIIGGSETTATSLSGVTFLLLTNPGALEKLKEEIRSSFQSENDINITSVGNLPYMAACLEEGLRMYPPVSFGLPRVVPKGGDTICGYYVPQDNVVAIHHWAMYHSEKHFRKPFEFHPERFLDDEEFANDKRDAFQPFHLGPRSCLGRNLAYVEMRIILARILFNFDLELADDSRDWMSKQKIYLLWQKGELNVYLKPRTTA